MFLCAEHVRCWKMSLKYTVKRTPYHILLERIPLKWIYSGAKRLIEALCRNLVNGIVRKLVYVE